MDDGFYYYDRGDIEYIFDVVGDRIHWTGRYTGEDKPQKPLIGQTEGRATTFKEKVTPNFSYLGPICTECEQARCMPDDYLCAVCRG